MCFRLMEISFSYKGENLSVNLLGHLRGLMWDCSADIASELNLV